MSAGDDSGAGSEPTPRRRGPPARKARAKRAAPSAETAETTTTQAQKRRDAAERSPGRRGGPEAGDLEATELESGAWLAERLRQLGARLSEAWRPRAGGVDADPSTFATLGGGDGRRGGGGGGSGALGTWRLAAAPKRRVGARAARAAAASAQRRPAEAAETAHRSGSLKAASLRGQTEPADSRPRIGGAQPADAKTASAAAANAKTSRANAAGGGTPSAKTAGAKTAAANAASAPPAAAPTRKRAGRGATPTRSRRRRSGPIDGPINRLAEIEGVQIHGAEFRGADLPPPEEAAAGCDALALILVHGAGLDHRDWTFAFARRLSERLGRQTWIFALDRPGFGQSERPNGPAIALPGAQARILRKAAESWGVRRAVVAGHSWGGAVAAAWSLAAQARPEDGAEAEMTVTGLASFAGALLPWSLTEAIRHGRRMRDAARTAMRAGGFGADGLGEAARQAIEESFSPNPVPDGYLEHVATRLSAIDGPTASTLADVSSINGALALSAPKLAELRTPVELVYGAEDAILSFEEQGERAHALLPSARLTRLDGVGHMVHHAAPEMCLAALDRLVAAAQ